MLLPLAVVRNSVILLMIGTSTDTSVIIPVDSIPDDDRTVSRHQRGAYNAAESFPDTISGELLWQISSKLRHASIDTAFYARDSRERECA